MSHELKCYRCGQALAALSLPLSRRDECPQCRVELHVCRMCEFYAPGRPDDCAEDDALEVTEKTRANFCDYFKPTANAYAPGEMEAEQAARSRLEELFGSVADPADDTEDGATSRAEDLFRN